MSATLPETWTDTELVNAVKHFLYQKQTLFSNLYTFNTVCSTVRQHYDLNYDIGICKGLCPFSSVNFGDLPSNGCVLRFLRARNPIALQWFETHFPEYLI